VGDTHYALVAADPSSLSRNDPRTLVGALALVLRALAFREWVPVVVPYNKWCALPQGVEERKQWIREKLLAEKPDEW
jgi:hypothetical protein